MESLELAYHGQNCKKSYLDECTSHNSDCNIDVDNSITPSVIGNNILIYGTYNSVLHTISRGSFRRHYLTPNILVVTYLSQKFGKLVPYDGLCFTHLLSSSSCHHELLEVITSVKDTVAQTINNTF
jgi:hypothetical protein